MSNKAIPSWIESKLFENILKETETDFEKILDFKISQALAPGENYATIMLKIQTEILLKDGETSNKSFMLKIPYDNEFYRQQMTKFDMFTIEWNMYHSIKPELENLYKANAMDVHFGATSYRLAIEQDYILLEDLTKKGFRNANRLRGLDLEHCEAVLKKLAQWHAATAVRMEEKGLYEKRYTKGILNENGKELFTTMLDSSFKHILKAVKSLKDHVAYIDQIESLCNKYVDIFFKECSANENEFNVLNHGDCWCNNIMFQYDKNGQLQDTYFVDYQVPCYGSPAQDLLYFIITSAELDIKVKKFDYMIKYYHDNLVKHLSILKYKKKIPSLKEIHQSLFKYGSWGFFAVFITLPAVLADSHKDATPDNLVGVNEESDKFKELIYSNERIAKHFEILLPWMCYRGTFEH